MFKTMTRLPAVVLLALSTAAFADVGAFQSDIPMLALSLIGTPYRVGGDQAQDGLDCSGLVKLVYRQAAHLELPRDTASLSQTGQAIDKDALQTGDLVFFNTQNRPASHVGIYLGEGRFVHASSSTTGSVKLSSMEEPYWAARYDGARRVLESGAGSQSELP